MFLCGAGMAVAAASRPDAAAIPDASTVTIYATAPAAGVPATPTNSTEPAEVPAIREGTWTVGTDVPPGTYRTAAEVSSNCYWQTIKSGTNGQEIIDTAFPGGGRPTVTLQVGQDFHTSHCGTWTKIG